MGTDPFRRPTVDDIKEVFDSFIKETFENGREVERLELSVPAEITTARGNIISAMTREISRQGIGLLHRGSVTPGEVPVKMASETREFEYLVELEWCSPCENGMFISGGKFIGKPEE